MRVACRVATLLVLVVSVAPAWADCGDEPADAAAVAAARQEVEATCDCAGAARHGEYVKCAAGVVRMRVATATLPRQCAGSVKKCAARSTCGKPGAVTCCRTKASGKTRCSIKRDAARCTGPGTCTGAFTSCCDACSATGCAPAPTSTTTVTSTSTTSTTEPAPCSGGPFMCGGSCPPALMCAPIGDFPPYCGCVPDGSQPCESETQPSCNGTCPAGQECGPLAIYTGAPCGCVPEGSTACGNASYATCGGACPSGFDCAPLRVSSVEFCSCVADDIACSCGTAGVCNTGEVCEPQSGPCGCTAP